VGRKLHYQPGSFYQTDDRTGFVQRTNRMRKEWDNLVVDQRVWEPRQPQDLVRGVKDDQNVNDARPLGPNVFVGPIFGALSANVAVGATVLPLQSTAFFSQGDAVGIMLDSGIVFNTTVNAPPGAGSISIAQGLPYTAASGNVVTNYKGPNP
jgi:hypothetical protein